MDRRSFVGVTVMGGAGSLGASAAQARGKVAGGPVVQKALLGMLAVQRRAWEQGVASQALLELGEEDLVVLMADEAVLRQLPDGRLGAGVASDEAVTDPASNGEPVLFAAKKTGDRKYKDAADRMLAYLFEKAPKTPDGILHHINTAPELWIDAMYMAPPFLAVAGKPEEAVKQVDGFRKYLWSTEKKLFSHIWSVATTSFRRRDYWGVGNGWAAAGMTRVIAALPAAMKAEGDRLKTYVREVLDGCLAHIRPDALFHDVVDKTDTFVETNLAQMLSYTIYRGVAAGWLDRSYLAQADRMRQAAHSKVDAYGMVHGVCGSPLFDRSGTACEGQAFFLLMEAARHDLKR
jgi:unsaturated rhamnogalacturonyl hydrolase